MTSRSFSVTSESVTEGHPDKVADQISDTVLDAVLRDLSHRLGVELPITESVCSVLDGSSLSDLAVALMGRRPTDE